MNKTVSVRRWAGMVEYTLRIVGSSVVVWSYHANIARRYATHLWSWRAEEEEEKERDDGEIDNIEFDDLTDSDDDLWLICFVLLNDVIHCISKAQ